MPSNPKRPREMVFEDGDILRADDPRPQRVPQYPSTGARRPLRKAEEAIPTSIYDTEKADEEMQAQYGVQDEYSQAFLYVERGPGAGQLLEVKQGTVVVGRASVSDLRIQHPSISRRHAQIKRVGEQFFIKDLGSQNGTFVNKERIATEVEARPGDSIAMGNALVRLRGPLQKGEKLPGVKEIENRQKEQQLREKKERAEREREERDKRLSTGLIARPSSPGRSSQSNTLKIAAIAGLAGFVLAAVLVFVVVKAVGGGNSAKADAKASKGAAVAQAEPSAPTPTGREKAIQDAIAKKMAEKAAAEKAAKAEDPTPDVETSAPVVVVRPDRAAAAPVVVAQPRPAAPTRVAAATPRSAPRAGASAAAKVDDAFDDDSDAKAGAGGSGKKAILAPYEKGNAEGSLELAKKAGDKALATQLTKFIQIYDEAQDAMMANNGTQAIKNFTVALQLDEQLSSGWGKYGGEIRRQLGNLYTLVGLQYASNGNDENAKKSFEAALKYDPSNARAKGQLAKFSEGGDEAAPAPAPKKAPAKPAKQSIDDAFGD